MSQSEKLNIYFCEFSSTNQPSNLPHIYGHLRLFAEKNERIKSHYNWAEPFLTYPVDVSKIKNPAVFAFSAYIWNSKRCIETAKQIKKLFPSCLVVFGGMQMNGKPIALMEEHPFIDLIVKKEGEVAFTEILLENLNSPKEWEKVKGIVFKDAEGIKETHRTEKLALSECTESPFEVYYDYYKTIKSPNLFSVLETTRGCPYSCTYCNWGALTENRLYQYPMEKVKKDIEYLSRLAPDSLHLADGNFGMLRRDTEIAQILVDEFDKNNPSKTYINATYAKVFNDGVLQTYKTLQHGKWKHGLTTLSVNSQTMNKESLRVIKRTSIGPHLIESKMSLIHKYFNDLEVVSSDFIIGLPGETLASFIDGILFLLSKGIYKFNVYALIVLPGAEIDNDSLLEKYGVKRRLENIIEKEFTGSDGTFIESGSIVYQTDLMNEAEIRYGMAFTALATILFPTIRMIFSEEEIKSTETLKNLLVPLIQEIIDSQKFLGKYMIEQESLFHFHRKLLHLLREDFKINKRTYFGLLSKLNTSIKLSQ